MQGSLSFVVFRLFGIGLSVMILLGLNQNHSNKKKASSFFKSLLVCIPIEVCDLMRYLMEVLGLQKAEAVFRTVYLILMAVLMVCLVRYAFTFIEVVIGIRNRRLRKVLELAVPAVPEALILIAALAEKSGTLALAGMLLLIVWLYNDNQNELISLDPLTRLNNRNELQGYLWYKLSTPLRGKVCLLMMDMNSFKSINDTYGHVEGDRALIRVAQCLKKACGGVAGRPFIARYGGDEFIIIMETESDEDVEHLCDYIHMMLAVENHRMKTPYELSISIGWVRNEQTNRLAKRLMARADKELYIKKKIYKERQKVRTA